MRIVGEFSFNNGKDEITRRYPRLLQEIVQVISGVDSARFKTKVSKEKTMPGKMLFDPTSINEAFKAEFLKLDWKRVRVKCRYSDEYFTPGYKAMPPNNRAFREMDFVKEKLGVEVQFGKYSFMVYNVCAKMTIFHNLGFIDTGVEIVPVNAFQAEMSTGVSYFEQFVWDLDKRGVANIDIPVLILGIDA